MTLTLELPPEIMRRLEKEAARRGQTVSEYTRAVLEQEPAPPADFRPVSVAQQYDELFLLEVMVVR
jgi:hypothetical protein